MLFSRRLPRPDRHRGFTLLELMVVVAIVALAAGLVVVSLPDPRIRALERDANRLAALLESARAQSRSAGVAVAWLPQGANAAESNFQFVGLPRAAEFPVRWLDNRIRAEVVGAQGLTLGPEPILPAQRVALRLEELQLSVQTDGLNPFAIQRPVDSGEAAK